MRESEKIKQELQGEEPQLEKGDFLALWMSGILTIGLPCLLLILLILALIALTVWRLVWVSPARCAARAGDEKGRWQAWMRALLDALAAMGETRPQDQTLAQWFADLDKKGRSPASLAPVGEHAGLVLYGAAQPVPGETGMTETAFRQLWQGMKASEKIRFRVTRFFRRRKAREG